jgi:hypothetical protein
VQEFNKLSREYFQETLGADTLIWQAVVWTFRRLSRCRRQNGTAAGTFRINGCVPVGRHSNSDPHSSISLPNTRSWYNTPTCAAVRTYSILRCVLLWPVIVVDGYELGCSTTACWAGEFDLTKRVNVFLYPTDSRAMTMLSLIPLFLNLPLY